MNPLHYRFPLPAKEMRTMDEPTIEELQAKILELSDSNEKLSTENDALKKAHEEDVSTIKQVRNINTMLYQKTSFGKTPASEGNTEDEDEHIETADEFLDSFIQPAKERMEEMYGVKFNGYLG